MRLGGANGLRHRRSRWTGTCPEPNGTVTRTGGGRDGCGAPARPRPPALQHERARRAAGHLDLRRPDGAAAISGMAPRDPRQTAAVQARRLRAPRRDASRDALRRRAKHRLRTRERRRERPAPYQPHHAGLVALRDGGDDGGRAQCTGRALSVRSACRGAAQGAAASAARGVRAGGPGRVHTPALRHGSWPRHRCARPRRRQDGQQRQQRTRARRYRRAYGDC